MADQSSQAGVGAMELTTRFGQAMVDGDADALGALLTSGFYYMHSNATVESATDLLQAVRAGRHFDRMDFEDTEVFSYGDTQLVRGLVHMGFKIGEDVVALDARITAVWVSVGGVLKLAAYQPTGLPTRD